MTLSQQEIAERKPVWAALSDLFLDTDVSLSYDYIVRVCSESNYTVEELGEILKDEVAPVVSSNLLSVAGEWAGFNEDWLVEAICDYSLNKGSVEKFVKKPLNTWIYKYAVAEHWEKLAEKIKEAKENSA